MEKSIKTLGICFVIGCLILSAALVYNKYTELKQSRYYFTKEGINFMVFDNVTGKVYNGRGIGTNSQSITVVDPIKTR